MINVKLISVRGKEVHSVEHTSLPRPKSTRLKPRLNSPDPDFYLGLPPSYTHKLNDISPLNMSDLEDPSITL